MIRNLTLAFLLLPTAHCLAQLSVIHDFNFGDSFTPRVRSTGVADGVVYGHTGLGGARDPVSYMFSFDLDGNNYRERNTIFEIGGYATPESGRGPLAIVNDRVYGSLFINEVFSVATSTLEGEQLPGGGSFNWVNPVPLANGQLAIGGGTGPTYGVKALDLSGNVVDSVNFAEAPIFSIASSGSDMYAASLYSSGLGIDGVLARIDTNDLTQVQTLATLDFSAYSLAIDGSTLFGLGDGGLFKVNTDGSDFEILDPNLQGHRILVHDETIYGVTSREAKSTSETLFKIGADGTGFETLHVFDDNDDSRGINADLTIIGSSLYGSTSEGGEYEQGFYYRYDLPSSPMDPNPVPEPSSIMTWVLLAVIACLAGKNRSRRRIA